MFSEQTSVWSAVLGILVLAAIWYKSWSNGWIERAVRAVREADSPLKEELATRALNRIELVLPDVLEQQAVLEREHVTLGPPSIEEDTRAFDARMDRTIAVAAGVVDPVVQFGVYAANTTYSLPVCALLGAATAVGLGIVGGVGVVKTLYRPGGDIQFRRHSNAVLAAVAVPAGAALSAYLLGRVADPTLATRLDPYRSAIMFTLAESLGLIAGIAEARYRIASHRSKRRRSVGRQLRRIGARVTKLDSARELFRITIATTAAFVTLWANPSAARAIEPRQALQAPQFCRIAVDPTGSVDSTARDQAFEMIAERVPTIVRLAGCDYLAVGYAGGTDTTFVAWTYVSVSGTSGQCAVVAPDQHPRGDLFGGLVAFQDARRSLSSACTDSLAHVRSGLVEHARSVIRGLYRAGVPQEVPRASSGIVDALRYLDHQDSRLTLFVTDLQENVLPSIPTMTSAVVVVLVPPDDAADREGVGSPGTELEFAL